MIKWSTPSIFIIAIGPWQHLHLRPTLDTRRDDRVGNVRKRVLKQMVLANEGMRTEVRRLEVGWRCWWQLPTQSLQGGTFTQYRAVQKSCEVLYIYILIYIYMYVCMYVWLCMNIDLGGALRKNGESQLPGTRSILRVAQLVAIYRTRRAPQPRQAAPCLSPAVAFPRHLLCSAIMPNWMTWPQTHSWWQKHEGVAWITWRVLFNTIK